MIQIFQSNQLLEDKLIFSPPETNSANVEIVEQIAATVFSSKNYREFKKLVEVTLETFTIDYKLYSVFVDNFPQYKTRLRSYLGIVGLRKRFGDRLYYEKEFDMPENQSLFVGFLQVDATIFPIFMEHLAHTILSFGILTDENDLNREELVDCILHEATDLDKVVDIDRFRLLVHLSHPGRLLFDFSTDGKDNLHLTFYGYPQDLNPAMDRLIDRLGVNFHLRRRREWFDYEGRREVQ